MSKPILAMDIPKECINCSCHFAENTGNIWCGTKAKELLAEDIKKYKRKWCPFRRYNDCSKDLRKEMDNSDRNLRNRT